MYTLYRFNEAVEGKKGKTLTSNCDAEGTAHPYSRRHVGYVGSYRGQQGICTVPVEKWGESRGSAFLHFFLLFKKLNCTVFYSYLLIYLLFGTMHTLDIYRVV